MDRTNAPNNVTISGRRTFADRNLPGTPGTEYIALDQANLQESIVCAIEDSGQAPANVSIGSRDTQLSEAMQRFGAWHVTTVSATGALTAANAGTVLIDASGGSVTITHPAASGKWLFDLVRLDGVTGHTVTINTAGGDHYSSAQDNLQTSFTIACGERVQTKGCAGNAVQVQRTRDGDWKPLAGSSSGTVPVGYTGIEVEVVGGGGGGGGGVGGGAGATARQTARGIMAGGGYSWAVGAGGASGSAGSDSTFSATWTSGSMAITAHGGAAGTTGGAGGTATGGDDNFTGGTGGVTAAGGASSLGGTGAAGSGGSAAVGGIAGYIRMRLKI